MAVGVTELFFGEEAALVYDRDFQLLLVANSVAVLGTALISPILDTLTGIFAVSPAYIGLLMPAFTAPAIVLIPISGLLTDRFGRKPVLLAGLLLFGTGGTAIAATTDFRVVVGLRLLQGIGGAGLVPVLITSIGDLYSGEQEATGQGIRFTISGLAQTVFPLLAGILVVIVWFYPFLLYAIAFPIALALYFRLEEPADGESRKPDAGETGVIRGDYLNQLRRLATQRRVAAILFARLIAMAPFIGFLTYNSLVVVRVIDGSPQQAGTIVALTTMTYAVAASQAGRITNAVASRAVPLICAHIALGSGLALVGVAESIVVAGIGAVILGGGVGIAFSLYRSVVTGFAPQQLRGGLVSVAESLGRLSATVTPIVMGFVISAGEPIVGFTAALQWTMLAVAAVGGVLGIVGIHIARNSPPVTPPA